MTLMGDVRYAVRSLRRQPTFTAVAVLTLVLGIGANTAIFSVFKAVLLNQLPYRDPARLVVVSEQNPDGNPDLDAPLTVPSVRATPNLFTLLGVNAALGRTFLEEEGQPGSDRVAILSRAFWQRQFGGSPSVVGRTIQLDAQPYTVVGVMPTEFDF